MISAKETLLFHYNVSPKSKYAITVKATSVMHSCMIFSWRRLFRMKQKPMTSQASNWTIRLPTRRPGAGRIQERPTQGMRTRAGRSVSGRVNAVILWECAGLSSSPEVRSENGQRRMNSNVVRCSLYLP